LPAPGSNGEVGWIPVLRWHARQRRGGADTGHSTRYDLTTGPTVCRHSPGEARQAGGGSPSA